MAGIVLENVSRVYPDHITAVDGVCFEVRDREFMVLVGPSGCGKTTTLRLIAGLDEPTSGRVWIGSRNVTDVSPKDRDIAMVFQNHALYPHLNVRRNLAFGLEMRESSGVWNRLWRKLAPGGSRSGASRTPISQRVGDAARMLGIDGLMDRLPGELSGGERQRVALGRAVVRCPAAFLFDEPLSNLDAQLRVELRRTLKELHARLQVTTLHVTHDQLEAMTLGERVAVMNQGKIQQVGSPEDVYRWPANRFVAGFIGTPPMNLIEGEVRQAKGALEFRRGRCAAPLAGRCIKGERTGGFKAILGIRPEHVTIGEFEEGLRGTVRDLEPIGDATLVTAEVDLAGGNGREHNVEANSVKIKTGPDKPWRVGETICLQFDPARVHLFDSLTGESLIAKRTLG